MLLLVLMLFLFQNLLQLLILLLKCFIFPAAHTPTQISTSHILSHVPTAVSGPTPTPNPAAILAPTSVAAPNSSAAPTPATLLTPANPPIAAVTMNHPVTTAPDAPTHVGDPNNHLIIFILLLYLCYCC